MRRRPRLPEPLPAGGPIDDFLRTIAATDRGSPSRRAHPWLGLFVLTAIVAIIVEVCLYSADRNPPIPDEHVFPKAPMKQ